MTPEPTPLELVPLGRMTLGLQDPLVLSGTPVGTFIVAELASATFEGERLNGTMKGVANADWLTISPDGTADLDVRILMETDDGALVYVQYGGRLVLATQTAFSAPLFRTGDERYTWLNGLQAVAKGQTDGKTLVYDVHEMR